MSNTTTYDRSNASLVANELKTRYESKKHGGYNIYEDEKVVIILDTYVPNLTIYIKLDGVLTCVFSAGYNSPPCVFKPGAWIDYIDNLAKSARQAKEEREREATLERNRRHAEAFGAIDDSRLFAGANSEVA